MAKVTNLCKSIIEDLGGANHPTDVGEPLLHSHRIAIKPLNFPYFYYEKTKNSPYFNKFLTLVLPNAPAAKVFDANNLACKLFYVALLPNK